MSKYGKWLLLGGLLFVATLATGGLDIAAISIATGLYYFFSKTK